MGYQIVIIGRSIGTGIASWLVNVRYQEEQLHSSCVVAKNKNKVKLLEHIYCPTKAKNTIQTLVLICPYMSMKHLAEDYFIGRMIHNKSFNNIEQLTFSSFSA